ncbi:MAG: QueT transporter family protein [Hespellia sp.]|nr:QueT transporter family protein [Hespellia sp.]
MKELKSNNKVLFMAQAAMIAAIYVVLTVVFAPLSFGEVQVRFAEALTILPFFTPAAIPGLFIGCLIGNIFGGAILPDIIFGSLATLAGAIVTYALRNRSKFLAPVGPIVANTIVVPLVLRYAYGVTLPIWMMCLSVGVGEVLSCGVLGMIVLFALKKYKNILFKKSAA